MSNPPAVLGVPAHHDPSPPAARAVAPPADGDRRASGRARAALGDVLAHGAVEIGFQPVVDLATGRPIGYEALARGPAAGPLEAPASLFAAARDAGRLDELDWLCQRSALTAALRAGLRAPSVLFLNVEADASGFLPLDLRSLYARATAQMIVAVEVTERALTRRPAALLGRVAELRALGCAVGLDDVGSAEGSLAMMAVLAPDVLKIDLAGARRALAPVVAAVAAQAERTGATILVERVETTAEARLADQLGARLAQGWLFGAREPLAAPPARPPVRPVPAAPHVDPRDVTPFALASEDRPVRRASRALLVELSRALEARAGAMGSSGVLVGSFQRGELFDRAARRRYAALARTLAFCGAVGAGMPDEPARGVRGAALHALDPLAREWTVAVVSPHASAALTAYDLDSGDRYDYVLTHDRELAARAATALMARIAP
ncbi:MAG TPA: EAL domain-containing protein [Solirubrobacteraceae bacterium]|nr:EAL domain-containing protein [Solirubrobacteraceae bacterium]